MCGLDHYMVLHTTNLRATSDMSAGKRVSAHKKKHATSSYKGDELTLARFTCVCYMYMYLYIIATLQGRL